MVTGFVYLLGRHRTNHPDLGRCYIWFLEQLTLHEHVKFFHVLLSHWNSFGKRLLIPFASHILKKAVSDREEFIRCAHISCPGVVSWLFTRPKSTLTVSRKKNIPYDTRKKTPLNKYYGYASQFSKLMQVFVSPTYYRFFLFFLFVSLHTKKQQQCFAPAFPSQLTSHIGFAPSARVGLEVTAVNKKRPKQKCLLILFSSLPFCRISNWEYCPGAILPKANAFWREASLIRNAL